MEKAKRQLRSQAEAECRAAQSALDKLLKQQRALREEVLKTLTGESAFETDLLNSMLAENKAAIAAAEENLANCQNEKDSQSERLRALTEQFHQITNWAREFDEADVDTRKMILARLIERIEVDKNYHLTIRFFVTLEEFRNTMSNGGVEIAAPNKMIQGVAS